MNSAPYQLGPGARHPESFELKKQLDASVIEPAVAERAASILFVLKKDVQLCFLVDFHKLNKMTLKDSYSFLRMGDCIVSLGQAKRFQR